MLHQFLPHHIGGTELYTWGLARRARDAGHEVHILHYVESAEAEASHFGIFSSTYQGVPVYALHHNLSVTKDPVRFEYAHEENQRFIAGLLQNLRPDLVHMTHLMKLSGSAMAACTEVGIPYFLTLTDFWLICPRHTLLKWNDELCTGPKHELYCTRCLHYTHGFFDQSVMDDAESWLRIRLNLEKRLFGGRTRNGKAAIALSDRNRYLRAGALRARKLLALSDFQRSMFIRQGYPDQSMLMIRHGLETNGLEVKTEMPANTGQIRLMYIGSIVHHKGLHLLLEAMQLTSNPRLTLEVYGDLTQPGSYMQQVRGLAELLPQVRLCGTFSPDEMGEVLQHADVLVLPALWYENEPLVVKAALYCHVPVLASSIGSLEEMIEDGKTGWLLPPGDLDAWRHFLDQLTPDQLDWKEGTYHVSGMDEHFQQINKLYLSEV